ncbi:MAG: 3-keto-disaccharide hydrolase [Pirellulales bacterium]
MKRSKRSVVGGWIAGIVVASIVAGWSGGTDVAVGAEASWTHWFANGGLDGFKIVSGTASYEVQDGVLVGTTADGSPNTFLATAEPVGDFELTFEVLVDDALNSGVQVRSHLSKEGDPAPAGAKGNKPLPAGRLYGPQCEIAINGTAGDFWDEARRSNWWSTLTETGAIRTDAAKAAFKKGEWNAYRIVVKGDHYRSWVNDVPAADFRQPHDPEGHIGFQVHGIKKGTGPYTVRWRKVMFRSLD